MYGFQDGPVRIANVFEEGKLGGPQVYVLRLASELNGHAEMLLVLPEDNSATFRQQCDAAGIRYEVVKVSRITKEFRVALRYFFCFPIEIYRLMALLRKSDSDIVYVCGGAWQYKGAVAGRLAGKKVLWHLNDTGLPWVFRKIFHVAAALADGYVYASERTKHYYAPFVRQDKPGYVIPSPVDTEHFDPLLRVAGDEEIIDRWSNEIVVGCVANISPVKGLETLVEAAAWLNQRRNRLRFVVIGAIYPAQQRYFERLQAMCLRLGVNNIEFVGARVDVRPLLRRYDIYLCSSNAESSPISVWEAMAMGKPVVSTDVGDVPVYVREGVNGFIASVGDAETLAQRVFELVESPGLRESLGRQAREIAVRELDAGRCAERHLNAYALIMNSE